jgi:hypothetical protein
MVGGRPDGAETLQSRLTLGDRDAPVGVRRLLGGLAQLVESQVENVVRFFDHAGFREAAPELSHHPAGLVEAPVIDPEGMILTCHGRFLRGLEQGLEPVHDRLGVALQPLGGVSRIPATFSSRLRTEDICAL